MPNGEEKNNANPTQVQDVTPNLACNPQDPEDRAKCFPKGSARAKRLTARATFRARAELPGYSTTAFHDVALPCGRPSGLKLEFVPDAARTSEANCCRCGALPCLSDLRAPAWPTKPTKPVLLVL